MRDGEHNETSNGWHGEDAASSTSHGTTAQSHADGGVQSLSRSDAHHLLQSERRRTVVRYLLSHDDHETFQMRAVAEDIAAWENGTTVEQLGSAERQRVYVSLYQSHLPKLDAYGVVDYDQPRGEIVVEPLARVLSNLVDTSTGLEGSETIAVDEGHVDDDRARDEDSSSGLLSLLGFPE